MFKVGQWVRARADYGLSDSHVDTPKAGALGRVERVDAWHSSRTYHVAFPLHPHGHMNWATGPHADAGWYFDEDDLEAVDEPV